MPPTTSPAHPAPDPRPGPDTPPDRPPGRADAPFTGLQVDALTRWQWTAGDRRLTCGAPRHEAVTLEPGRDGLRCPLADCGYRQDWAPAPALQPHSEPGPASNPAPASATAGPQCGEECCEGHVYAGRCAHAPAPLPGPCPESAEPNNEAERLAAAWEGK